MLKHGAARGHMPKLTAGLRPVRSRRLALGAGASLAGLLLMAQGAQAQDAGAAEAYRSRIISARTPRSGSTPSPSCADA